MPGLPSVTSPEGAEPSGPENPSAPVQIRLHLTSDGAADTSSACAGTLLPEETWQQQPTCSNKEEGGIFSMQALSQIKEMGCKAF